MKKLNHIVRIALVFALTLSAFGALAAEQPVVNINTAQDSELTLLPRVGPALAQRIIEYREENGSFEQTDDLLLVRGIGEKTFALMESYVAVKGETTLREKLKVSDLERQNKTDDTTDAQSNKN